MDITFVPALTQGTDYSLKFKSSTKVVLTLMEGRQWRKDEGLLMATEIEAGGRKYPLAGGAGIRVASVLMNPSIKAGAGVVHNTQSKVISFDGSGFTSLAYTKVTLHPTKPEDYKLLAVQGNKILLQLLPDEEWLPLHLSQKLKDGKLIPLQVVSIDTGAGELKLPEPVTIGFVIADRPGEVCDDSCEFAFDGICDDGSKLVCGEVVECRDDKKKPSSGDVDGLDADGGDNEEFKVSACVKGTDCTDCGGVDTLPLPPGSKVDPCTNTCVNARDGVCDDPRGESNCGIGTDCQDCGPVGASNWTRSEDDGIGFYSYLRPVLGFNDALNCRLVGRR